MSLAPKLYELNRQQDNLIVGFFVYFDLPYRFVLVGYRTFNYYTEGALVAIAQ